MFNVPWYLNYFWGLIFITLLVWILEIVFPWRSEHGVFRKDFFGQLVHGFKPKKK
tara:strand:+ start:53641 stop:53805 length:165 start_codon:yes stop_codon:yes gene_type:complete